MDLGSDGLGWAGLARPHVITFHADIICQLQCAAQRFNTSGRAMRARAHLMYASEYFDIKVYVNCYSEVKGCTLEKDSASNSQGSDHKFALNLNAYSSQPN